MSPEEIERRALSFGATAETYDRVRPTYPLAAVRWMTEGIPGQRVADVGAGTGKMTRVLVEAGLEVTAVEPDPGMRAVHRGAPVVEGRGEQLPFGEASLDSVIYAQAWHWTAESAALAEAVRVLRTGGTLGLAWNTMDTTVEWVRAVDAVTEGLHLSEDRTSDPTLPGVPGLAPVEVAWFPWTQELTPEEVATLAGTWSWVATRPAEEKAAILAGVLGIAEAAAVDGVCTLPRSTCCLRSRRV